MTPQSVVVMKLPLEAGVGSGFVLVDGDLKWALMVLITHVDGEKVVAFGHPFLNMVLLTIILCNASIFTVVKL